MIRERRLEPYEPENIEVKVEDWQKLKNNEELYEHVLYRIKEAIEGWDELTPEGWANTLAEIDWLFRYYEVDV